ncbi:MAG: type III pantothenate kinase [Rhodothermaceae bacterium]
MLLTFDVGNTFVKYGIYQGSELQGLGKVKADEIAPELFHDFDIKEVAISSVVPQVTENLVSFCQKHFSVSPFVISSESKFNLSIDYRTPHTLGLDRLCGAEGAFAMVLKEHNSETNEDPIVTVDFGTATTINLIRPGGVFAGGIIAPGIETMINSLFKRTAQLPKIDFADYREFIGKDTNSSIASGIMNASVGLIEKSLSKISAEYQNKQLDVFLTGGNSALINPYIEFKCSIVKDLVIKGVYAVNKLNKI